MSSTNWTISFSEGNLTSAFANPFTLTSNNTFKAVGTNLNATKIALQPNLGLLNGTFRLPDNTNILIRFNGAFLQDQQLGGGQFLDVDKAGAVVLENASP